MISSLFKPGLRQNQHFGRIASMCLTGEMPTSSPTMMEPSVPKGGNHLTIRHSQEFLSQVMVTLIEY